MNKVKLLTILGLLLYCVIIFLPPIIYGYVYPNLGDDAAGNLAMIDRIKSGDPIAMRFTLSYSVIGYPIIWLNSITGISIDTLFMWFHSVVLCLIGLVLYTIFSKLINRHSGWIALFLIVFSAQSILFQFYYGQIFNLINIGIIFPILLFFFIRYVTERKLYQLILVVLLSILFGGFHMSGVYLPFIALFILIVYSSYCFIKKRKFNMRGVYLGIGIVGISSVAFFIIIYSPWSVILESLSNGKDIVSIIRYNVTNALSVPVSSYLMDIVSPTILLLSALSVVYYPEISRKIDNKVKLLLLCLGCLAVLLALVTFTKLSLDPYRQALDLATIFAMIIAVCIGILLNSNKSKAIIIMVSLMIAFGLYHNLPTWFSNNSAIKLADKEAIAYINKLELKTYSTSSQVAPWIYERYLKSKWIKEDGELLIVRNLPMTPRSDESNIWYGGHGILPDDDYILTETLEDNGIIISIYTRIK